MLITHDIMQFITVFFVIVCLVSLAVIDIKHYILPNELNLILALLFIIFHVLDGWQHVTIRGSVMGALAGGGLLLFLHILAHKFYQEDSLGLGDVKLMAAAGFGLGFPDIMLALTLGAVFGMCHGAVLFYCARLKGNKNIHWATVNVPAGFGFCLAIGIVFGLRTFMA